MELDVVGEYGLGLCTNSGADLGIVFPKEGIFLFWDLTKAVFGHSIMAAVLLDIPLAVLKKGNKVINVWDN